MTETRDASKNSLNDYFRNEYKIDYDVMDVFYNKLMTDDSDKFNKENRAKLMDYLLERFALGADVQVVNAIAAKIGLQHKENVVNKNF